MNLNRVLENTINFLGDVTFATGVLDPVGQTQIGGLSGITYDPLTGSYYAISDDPNLGRFYRLNNGDIQFTNVTTLKDTIGNPLAAGSLDTEGIALASNGELYISSEGNTSRFDPFINKFSLTGNQLSQLTIPDKFLPTATRRLDLMALKNFEATHGGDSCAKVLTLKMRDKKRKSICS